jgi:hypothetical protein
MENRWRDPIEKIWDSQESRKRPCEKCGGPVLPLDLKTVPATTIWMCCACLDGKKELTNRLGHPTTEKR